jgi:5-methylcytosine-specific restriction endonuclease McrA
MKCKIDGCDTPAAYKSDQVCQKHYFRLRRTGSYYLPETRAKYRTSNPAGYQILHEPDHALADNRGKVYEHRFVYFNAFDGELKGCALCGEPISWDDCHIDHKDCDVTNNAISNLRATCPPCNTFRGHSPTSMGKHLLTANGKTMTAAAWSRQKGVEVTGSTIKRRKAAGASDHDAIFGPRKTHHSTQTKKYKAKFDKVRGIG